MEPRFFLRFETGERSGERVPIPAGGLGVGRLSENELVLAAGSVSGRHARLTPAGDDVVLRDQGSTNGTWVGAERVDSRLLVHGDIVRIGSFLLAFEDSARSQVEEREPAPPRPLARVAPARAPEPGPLERTVLAERATLDPEAAGEAVGDVAPAALARSGRRSLQAGLLLGVALAGALGLYAWLSRGRGEAGVVAEARADAENLLGESWSFEQDGGWQGDPRAPRAFAPSADWRVSGHAGVGVELARGEWARLVSSALPVSGRDALRVRAEVRVEGEAQIAVGLELSSSRGAAPPLVALSEPGDGTVELVLDPVAGCDRVRVVLEARVPGLQRAALEPDPAVAAEPAEIAGAAGADDLELRVEPAGGAAGARFEEYELLPLGARAALLARIDRVLLFGIGFADAGGAALRCALEPSETGMRLVPEDGARALRLTVAAELAQGGSATLGESGNQVFAGAFESERATDLLLGAGLDLLRLSFGAPARVEARPGEHGLEVEVDGELAAVELQVAFRAERAAAMRLAEEARAALRAGTLGIALARWAELCDRVPFDEELVAEARAARARGLAEGLAEVRALEHDLERARFFGLADLHSSVRARAVALAERYRGSEVEQASAGVREAIEQELVQLQAERESARVARLSAVLAVLGERGDAGLREHVAAALARGDEER